MKLKDKIQEAEKLLQYKKCVAIKGKSTYQLVAKAYLDYNGYWSVNVYGSIMCSIGARGGINFIGQSVTVPTHLYYTENIPIDVVGTLTEIEPILDIIPQITSYKSYNDSYISNNAKIKQQIVENKQKIIELDGHVQALKLKVESFKIKDSITTLNPQQKSHILQKIWGSNDNDSISIINAIKECGFNPNYVDNQGRSLLKVALTNNDNALFDLLIANHINFNSYIGSKTAFQMILESGNNPFIGKMFGADQDVSKALLDIALNNDASSLAKAFAHKLDLAKTKYSGYSLLQLALEKNKYESAKQILTSYPEAINLINNNGLSVLASTILQGNKTGVDLLKSFGANLDLEVTQSITGKYIQYFTKLLTISPDLLAKNYDGLPIGHFIIKHGNSQLLAKLLELQADLCNSADSEGRDLLYFTILMDKPDLAKLLMDNGAAQASTVNKALADNNVKVIIDLANLNPEILKYTINDKTILHIALEQNNTELISSLVPISDTIFTVKNLLQLQKIDLAIKLCKLDSPLLPKLANAENNQLTNTLLQTQEFMKLVDIHGDNLLHLACKNGNKELIIEILKNDSTCINNQNSDAQTPLHILLGSAIDNITKAQIAKIILTQHPDIMLKDSDQHSVAELATSNAEILTMFYEENLLGENEINFDS